MDKKRKSIAEILRIAFEKLKNEVGEDDLLDLIPSYAPAAEARAQFGVNLGKQPRPEEIRHSATTDEMILEGHAVLKDRRTIYWN